MKKSGIMNQPIATVISGLGHTDAITIADAGLPIPDGFCLDAAAYRAQLEALDLTDAAH